MARGKSAGQRLLDALDGNVQLDVALPSHRDSAGFFGNDESDTIRLLGDADGGTVPRSQVARQQWICGEWEKTGRGRNAIAMDNYGAIMQRAERLENRAQQVARHLGVKRDSTLDESSHTDLALHHDQGTD